MAFELGEVFNGGAEWLCGSSLVFGVLRNPVVTALLITALALIVICALSRPDFKRAGWRLGFKTGFWLLVVVSAVVFTHYYALGRHLREGSSQRGLRDVVDSVNQSARFGGGYAVYSGPGGGEEGGGGACRSCSDAPPPAGGGLRPDNVGGAPPTPPDDDDEEAGGGGDLQIKEVVLPSSRGRPGGRGAQKRA